jgi:hypothetical protein
MTIAEPSPKYVMIVVHSKFKRKSPLILKLEFLCSIEMSVRFVKAKTADPRSEREAGTQNPESDEEFENAPDSIRKSVEPDSNVTLESALH